MLSYICHASMLLIGLNSRQFHHSWTRIDDTIQPKAGRKKEMKFGSPTIQVTSFELEIERVKRSPFEFDFIGTN